MSTERARNSSRRVSEVPLPGDPDRKRVLNVLAQRRYRERKRQRLAELEAKVRATNPDANDRSSTEQTSPAATTAQPNQQFLGIALSAVTHTSPVSFSPVISSPQPFPRQTPTPLPTSPWSGTLPDHPSGVKRLNRSSISPNTGSGKSPPELNTLEPFSIPTPSNSDDSGGLSDGGGAAYPLGPAQLLACEPFFPGLDEPFPAFIDPSAPLHNHVFLDTTGMPVAATEEDNNNHNLLQQATTSYSSPTTMAAWQSYSPSTVFPPSIIAADGSFAPYATIGLMADDRVLDYNIIKVMKAGTTVAEMLNVREFIWDPLYTHVLRTEGPTNLPPHFKPTKAQKHIPHHPIFDVFPWASARTKFICIFSQPVESRPPAAKDPLAIMHLLMDIDDEAEGFRIDGEDGFDASNWEIGEKFFQHWWWALDRDIVDNSNRIRAKRGAKRLKLTEKPFWSEEQRVG